MLLEEFQAGATVAGQQHTCIQSTDREKGIPL